MGVVDVDNQKVLTVYFYMNRYLVQASNKSFYNSHVSTEVQDYPVLGVGEVGNAEITGKRGSGQAFGLLDGDNVRVCGGVGPEDNGVQF